jgi:tetratricopeptide (TPR) repeat protein
VKKRNYYLLVVLLISFAFLSCNKKMIVATDSVKERANDQSAFNYLYSEGLKQKLLGNGADALKNFEQCVLINPLSDASYYEMAEITISNGDMNSGKKYSLKAISINEKNIWYLSRLAGIYYQEKNLDSSIIYYEKVINYFPERDDIRLELGNVYSENKQYDKAVTVFGYLDDKFGINESSTVLKVKNLMLSGNNAEAEKIILLLIDKFPDEIMYRGLLAENYGAKGEPESALKIYNDLLDKYPTNSELQLSLIDFLEAQKYYDDLVGFLNTVTINSEITKDDKVSLFIKLFEDTVLINNYSPNLELSLILLESENKDDENVSLLRSELYQKEGRIAEAISNLNEYIKRFPDNYYGWEQLLLLYSQTEDYEMLYVKGKECATKFNMSILAKLLYASGASGMKDYKSAIEELKKATILANEDKEIMTQILSMEADVYYKMGDYDNAFSKYDELLKISPDNIGILNNYAYFLAEQNRNLKEAEEMSKRTIIAEKDNATFLDTYAWILFKRGRLKEASRIMEGIISGDAPEDAEYYEHYGYILKGMNNCKEAVIYWDKAIKKDSNKVNLNTEISNCQTGR